MIPNIWTPHTHEWDIQRGLEQLDDRLFLTREYDEWGQQYYEIRLWVGESIPPYLIVDWREKDGRAKDLAWGLVIEIQRMMHRGPIDTKEIHEANLRLQEKKAEERQELYRELVKEFERYATFGHFSGPVHRSQALRMARRKRQYS